MRAKSVGCRERSPDPFHSQKHLDSLEMRGKTALFELEFDEPVSGVKGERLRFRIDENTSATDLVSGEFDRQQVHVPQQCRTNTTPLSTLINGHPRQPDHRHGIRGQSLPLSWRELRDFHLSRAHCREADDLTAINRDVRYPELNSKLVLPSEPLKETIEFDVPRPELAAVVTRKKNSDLHCATIGPAQAPGLCAAPHEFPQRGVGFRPP